MLEFVDDELLIRAALDAQFERAQATAFETYAFNRLLRAAIDTEYVSPVGNRHSAGIDWMRSKKRNDDQEDFQRLVGLVHNPVEVFTAHNEYNPHISDVVCSCLFEAFIPADMRDSFALSVLPKWGTKKSGWTRFAVYGGMSHQARAEIVYGLATTKTKLMDRGRYVRYLTRNRPQDHWDASREWSVLNDANVFNLALACLSHAPKVALEESTAKDVAFVPYLESILGKPVVRYIIEKALESYSAAHGKQYTLESFREKVEVKPPANQSTPAKPKVPQRPLDAHIDEALKTGILHKLRKAVGAHAVDAVFIDDYRTHYYKRIKQSGSKWVKHVVKCFSSVLQESGWQTGKAVLEEWDGKPMAYVHVPIRGRNVRYVQRVGTYLPQAGEEVIYRPDRCHGIALDLYVVTFMPLAV